jgi:hypothetical protein
MDRVYSPSLVHAVDFRPPGAPLPPPPPATPADVWSLMLNSLIHAFLRPHPPTEASIDATADLYARCGELEQRVVELERLARLGQDRSHTLERQQSRLDSQVSALLAARTRERPDLASNQHSEQQLVAREYRSFVEQRLQALARTLSRRSSEPAANSQHVAMLLSRLTRLFFDRYLPVSASIRQDLDVAQGTPEEGHIRSVHAAAEQLRRRAQNGTLDAHWDFTCTPAVGIDDQRQEPWGSCDPRAAVRFVVAPAYVVDQQVFARQYVFTSHEPWY